ncbi:MAG: HDOD domain-containing protein [Desulforhabdus sp.]|jgi:HD-like signal output (HDOD) protein|nr:HDOD domain-containing protein [Desulforhabdus sp.]
MKIDPPFLDDRDVLDRIAQVRELPVLFGTFENLWQLIRDTADFPAELETILRYDPVLAAIALRLANSKVVGHTGRVDTLSGAIDIIGVKGLKSACLSNLLKIQFSDTGEIEACHRERLWKHAYITARMAAEIAEKRGWISGQQAYLLGLIHDIGSTVAAYLFPEHYRYLQGLSIDRKIASLYIETEHQSKYALIGERLAIEWCLPAVCQKVIRHHHQPHRANGFGPEVKMIGLARILADSSVYPQFLSYKAALSYCADLYITQDEWEGHVERVSEIRTEGDHIWRMLS